MFTGIIEATGTVNSLHGENLDIFTTSSDFHGLKMGTSISVDGVCLTLRKFSDNVLTFQVSKESIQRSIISKYNKGSEVNLELPLTMEKFLSGHLVQGHVDTVTSVLKVNEISEDLWNYEFKNNDYKYLVDKGSVTVNGISLTVVNPTDEHFTVAVIRETYNRTNFKNLNVDSIVNIEFDIMAKYVERFLNDK